MSYKSHYAFVCMSVCLPSTSS